MEKTDKTSKRNKILLDLAATMRNCRESGEFDSSYLGDWADRIEDAVNMDNDRVNLLFQDKLGKRLDDIEKLVMQHARRNVDRFNTETEAQVAFLNEEWLISVDDLSHDPFEEWNEHMKTRYAEWLFEDPVESRRKLKEMVHRVMTGDRVDPSEAAEELGIVAQRNCCEYCGFKIRSACGDLLCTALPEGKYFKTFPTDVCSKWEDCDGQ